jgi:two-component system, chemotaxis family, CheB/CheR fusion protein
MIVDTDRLKIASFKTKEKLWDEFVVATHKNGSNVTSVLESAIADYLAGEYIPTPKTASVAKASNHAPESPPNLTGIHVLILDDEANIRISITSILEHFGATVTAIASPAIAIQTLQADPQQYHVLISDIGMPEQDGWSFIRQVRGLSPEAGGKIPAAALTTYSSPREIDIAKRLGFQVHISKPIDANLLASIVADLART